MSEKFNLVGPTIEPYEEGSQQLHIPHTNPGHTKATLYVTPPPDSQDMIGTMVAEVKIVAPNTVQFTIPENFKVITTDGRGKGTENANCLNDVIGPTAAPLQLWYRCPSCNNRTMGRIFKTTDEVLCKHCGRGLRLVHWTGRVGDDHTAPIIDITPEYANAWLKANGWIQRKYGLWAKIEFGIVNYVDFTKKPYKPTMYAYNEDGSGKPDRRTPAIGKVYRELMPYFNRLTAKEIAMQKSHPDRMYKVLETEIPEDKPAPESLQSVQSIQNVQHLVDKCPECESEDLRTVENADGKATTCINCQHVIFNSKEEENDSQSGQRIVDSTFF